jgi:DNA-binding GntR family transcriptional regulator
MPVINEHDQIYDALVEGHLELAQESLRHHLRAARDLLRVPPALTDGGSNGDG